MDEVTDNSNRGLWGKARLVCVFTNDQELFKSVESAEVGESAPKSGLIRAWGG